MRQGWGGCGEPHPFVPQRTRRLRARPRPEWEPWRCLRPPPLPVVLHPPRAAGGRPGEAGGELVPQTAMGETQQGGPRGGLARREASPRLRGPLWPHLGRVGHCARSRDGARTSVPRLSRGQKPTTKGGGRAGRTGRRARRRAPLHPCGVSWGCAAWGPGEREPPPPRQPRPHRPRPRVEPSKEESGRHCVCRAEVVAQACDPHPLLRRWPAADPGSREKVPVEGRSSERRYRPPEQREGRGEAGSGGPDQRP